MGQEINALRFLQLDCAGLRWVARWVAGSVRNAFQASLGKCLENRWQGAAGACNLI